MVRVGSAAGVVRVVGDSDTAIALGSGDLPVLATPILIALMEAAACQALAGQLPPERTSVGSRVDVRHLAPSPVGAHVTARAEIVAVEGAMVRFDVSASHEVDGETVVVGSGSHVRFVVDREAFLA